MDIQAAPQSAARPLKHHTKPKTTRHPPGTEGPEKPGESALTGTGTARLIECYKHETDENILIQEYLHNTFHAENEKISAETVMPNLNIYRHITKCVLEKKDGSTEYVIKAENIGHKHDIWYFEENFTPQQAMEFVRRQNGGSL